MESIRDLYAEGGVEVDTDQTIWGAKAYKMPASMLPTPKTSFKFGAYECKPKYQYYENGGEL